MRTESGVYRYGVTSVTPGATSAGALKSPRLPSEHSSRITPCSTQSSTDRVRLAEWIDRRHRTYCGWAYFSWQPRVPPSDNFGNPNRVIRDPRVRGFDHYYGFTENHSQDMFDGTYHLRSDGPYAVPERQYTYADSNQNPGTFYQTDAIGDYALDFLANNRLRNETEQTNDPFFTYVAFGAPHFPLQARDEWIEEVLDRNVFQKGWDQLRVDHYTGAIEAGIIDTSVQLPDKGWVPQRNGDNPTLHEIADWDSLPADRQADLVRRMAIYAAAVERVDHQIGRILDDLETNGELDNTIIVFSTDNGADGEWHEFGFEHDEPIYSVSNSDPYLHLDTMGSLARRNFNDTIFLGTGWANASAAPYRNYKHYTHEGGIKSPAIIQWNDGLNPALAGTVSNQISDIRNLMPTLLELAGVEYPAEWTAENGLTYETRPILTESLAGFLETGVVNNNLELGWWHEGNRAFRSGDWKLVSSNYQSEGPAGPGSDEWELYDLASDPTELNNLAGNAAFADQFDFMLAGYNRWAWQNDVTSTLPWSAADFNRDGQLTMVDLAAFLNGWGQEEAVGSMQTFAAGDLDLDGDTDVDDWVRIRIAFELGGQQGLIDQFLNVQRIPEPSAAIIMAGVLAAGLGYRRLAGQ